MAMKIAFAEVHRHIADPLRRGQRALAGA